jgi:hypothetical protein
VARARGGRLGSGRLYDERDEDRTNGCERATNTLEDCGGCDILGAP